MYLGCDIETYRAYIEDQFEPGMTWENHTADGWHIDHIIPIKFPGAAGGPPTLEEVSQRLHYTNTQPMWAVDNISKGNRFVGRKSEPVEEAVAPAPTPLTDADIESLLECLGLE